MSTSPRTRRRFAALFVSLSATAALLGATGGTGNAATLTPATAPTAHRAPLGVVVVGNPGTQTNLQYDDVYLQMTVGGGTYPYTWSASNLPLGTSINASTGLITGMARGSGTRTVTVTATDATGVPGSTTFTWRVIRDACPRC
ncbi:putative Ig domain-containing protein [Streptomyces sp. NRRL S-87]|uniref:putative Ig domain-containing protein n=1 Tax=Streptomyces sp. NRRL S-87 TaxID=1463920 RepID=UPI0004C126F7|nr:putative Ig domain-containing protein [Streptomyces sp. NRRL S-87]